MSVRIGDRVTVTGEVLRATSHVNGTEVHILVSGDDEISAEAEKSAPADKEVKE